MEEQNDQQNGHRQARPYSKDQQLGSGSEQDQRRQHRAVQEATRLTTLGVTRETLSERAKANAVADRSKAGPARRWFTDLWPDRAMFWPEEVWSSLARRLAPYRPEDIERGIGDLDRTWDDKLPPNMLIVWRAVKRYQDLRDGQARYERTLHIRAAESAMTRLTPFSDEWLVARDHVSKMYRGEA